MSNPENKAFTKITVTGRVTKEPSGGQTKSGDSYLRLNIASEDDAGNTVWYDGVAYGLLAQNLVTRVKKGAKCRFKGLVKQREFQKKDGTMAVSNNLTLDSIQLVEGGKLVTVDEFSVAPEPERAPF